MEILAKLAAFVPRLRANLTRHCPGAAEDYTAFPNASEEFNLNVAKQPLRRMRRVRLLSRRAGTRELRQRHPCEMRTACIDPDTDSSLALDTPVSYCFFVAIPLFDQLRQLKLPRQGYAVFGSGPLAIRGIIPLTHDLDVICSEAVWNIVRQIGSVEYLPEYDVSIVIMSGGALTFGTKWGIGNFDVDELIATAEIIDDLPFVRLEHVVSYKKIRSSEKDLLHVDALENYAQPNVNAQIGELDNEKQAAGLY